MATTQPKPGGKAGSKRVWIIVGVIGLAVVAYLYFRSAGSTAAAAPAAADTTSPSSVPQTGSSGDSSGTDQASADLLGALAGENQQLMQSFLASENGLVSLAGSSVGAFQTSAGEPSSTSSGFGTSTVQPSVSQPSPLNDVGVPQDTSYADLGVTPSPVVSGPAPAPDTLQVQPLYSGTGSFDLSSSTSSVEIPTYVSGSAQLPVYTPPSYGITTGPAAGKRVSGGSVH